MEKGSNRKAGVGVQISTFPSHPSPSLYSSKPPQKSLYFHITQPLNPPPTIMDINRDSFYPLNIANEAI